MKRCEKGGRTFTLVSIFSKENKLLFNGTPLFREANHSTQNGQPTRGERGDQCLSVHPLKKGVAKFKPLLSLIEPIKVFALKSVHKKVAKVCHSIGKVERPGIKNVFVLAFRMHKKGIAANIKCIDKSRQAKHI